MAFSKGKGMEEVPGTGETQDETEVEAKDTPKVRQEIKAAFKRIEEIDNERDAANKDKAAQFDHLASLGVSKKGAQSAYKRFRMRNDEERESHDFSFMLCCKATGIGFQEDLPGMGKK